MPTHRPTRLAATLLPLLPLLALGACNSSHNYYVNGVRLKHERWVDFAAEPLLPTSTGGVPESEQSLSLALKMGDVRVHAGQHGERRGRARLREYEPMDARLVWQQGRIELVTSSGKPGLVMELDLYLDQTLKQLSIETNHGDLSVKGVQVSEHLNLNSNLGDLEVQGVGAPREVELATNLGDVELSDFNCLHLNANSDLGDIELENVNGAEAKLETSLGDVDLERSAFKEVNARTSLGDVEGLESTLRAGRESPLDLSAPKTKPVVREV